MHVPDLGPVPQNTVPQAATPVIEQVNVGMFHLAITDTGAGAADLNYVLPNGRCYTFRCSPETIASLRLSLAKIGAPIEDSIGGETP